MTALTCEHCESEIDFAKDPRCVIYDPSGATDVMCEACRERAHNEKMLEAYPIKRGWRA